MNQLKKLLLIASLMLLLACGEDDDPNLVNPKADLESLPTDNGGTHFGFPLGSTSSTMGYYLYEPQGYQDNELEYPLLVFLHGFGQIGRPGVAGDLGMVLDHGPPHLIFQNNWNTEYPMLVASPQLTSEIWQPNQVQAFINHIALNYRVNPQRIYLTGLSIGGRGSFEYVRVMGERSRVAAIVPIAGEGVPTEVANFRNLPVWAFHGEADTVIPPSGSIDMVTAINAQNPELRARLTLFPEVEHNSWERVYNGSGIGQGNPEYDLFDQAIYSWFFNFKKED